MMKASEFCYWLQGFFELNEAGPDSQSGLTPTQSDMIERHLALVFKHDIDPKQGTLEEQKILQEIHDGPKPKIDQTYRC